MVRVALSVVHPQTIMLSPTVFSRHTAERQWWFRNYHKLLCHLIKCRQIQSKYKYSLLDLGNLISHLFSVKIHVFLENESFHSSTGWKLCRWRTRPEGSNSLCWDLHQPFPVWQGRGNVVAVLAHESLPICISRENTDTLPYIYTHTHVETYTYVHIYKPPKNIGPLGICVCICVCICVYVYKLHLCCFINQIQVSQIL